MAWTPVGSTPGTLSTAKVCIDRRPIDDCYVAAPIAGVDIPRLVNPIYGIPFVTTQFSGEIEYASGGGGTPRPSTGLVWPRT